MARPFRAKQKTRCAVNSHSSVNRKDPCIYTARRSTGAASRRKLLVSVESGERLEQGTAGLEECINQLQPDLGLHRDQSTQSLVLDPGKRSSRRESHAKQYCPYLAGIVTVRAG